MRRNWASRPAKTTPRAVKPASLASQEGEAAQSPTGDLGFSHNARLWKGYSPTTSNPALSKQSKKPTIEVFPKAPPAGIPFTKADAQFIYGHSSVHAALKSQRRKLYNLYIHKRAEEHADEIKDLAEKAKMSYIVDVGNDWLPAMDKRSEGRPHNGLLLEASPIPVLNLPNGIATPRQWPEDEAHNPNTPWTFQPEGLRHLLSKTPAWRSPVFLLLDDVLDPQNLGSILRSAYFLGVDAVGLVQGTVAPLTSTVLKASAGAAEAIPLFSVPRTIGAWFGASSAWKILAAVTPPAVGRAPQDGDGSDIIQRAELDAELDTENRSGEGISMPGDTSSLISITPNPLHATNIVTPDPIALAEFCRSPASVSPILLVIGGESRGLSKAILSRADAFVHVARQISQDEVGVDSLNVGVAAAMAAGEVVRRALANKNLRGQQLASELGRRGSRPERASKPTPARATMAASWGRQRPLRR